MRNPLAGVSLTMAVVASAFAAQAATAYFKADFQSGSIPKTMTAADVDALPLLDAAYKHGKTTAGWTVDMAGSHGYAAISPTHTGPGTETKAQDNRLTSKTFTVDDARAVLRWEARSMLPGMGEAYTVSVIAADGSATEIFSTADEADWWVTHVVSLAPWAGEEIALEWRCVSTNRYILAIDNIFAGLPDEESFVATDRTQRWQAAGSARATGTAVNTGFDADIAALVLLIDNEEAGRIALEDVWKACETLDYDFELPGEVGDKVDFEVSALRADGTYVQLTTGTAELSHYARRHVIDDASGMWCNSCPDGHLVMEALQRDYPGQIIPMEIHINDVLGRDDYWAQLGFYAAPYYMPNRDSNVKTSNRNTLAAALSGVETTADLRLVSTVRDENSGLYTFTLEAESAVDIDNAADRYRVGYVVLRDIHDPDNTDYYQLNNGAIAAKEHYYFLPSSIYSGLVMMHNVVSSFEGAFDGVAGSLGTSLTAYEPVQAEVSIELGEYDADPSKARVAFLLLDTETGYVHNATVAELADADMSGVTATGVATAGIALRVAGGRCLPVLDRAGGDFTLDLTDLTGRTVARISGPADTVEIELPRLAGPVIGVLRQDGATATAKIMNR